ncbi:MAG: hypothetical protein AAF298_09860 [Cyanobacteria bacterium P01_A01_bin.40]
MYYGPYPKYPTYTSFTSYINSNNLPYITQSITNVLTKEDGYELLPELPYLMMDIENLKTRYRNERPPLLIVALASGKNDWTVVRTYPNEWLFLRANGVRPRLSDISMQLECNAFYYRVIYDSDNLLMEVDSKGNFRFDYTMFPQFSLIDIPKAFFEVLEIAKEKPYGGYLYGNRCAGELIAIKLAELINPSQYFEVEDLYYMVYKDIQRLRHMKIKILYFLPPDNYLSTLPRYDDEPDEYYDMLTGAWYES